MKKLVALLMALALLCSSIGAFATGDTVPAAQAATLEDGSGETSGEGSGETSGEGEEETPEYDPMYGSEGRDEYHYKNIESYEDYENHVNCVVSPSSNEKVEDATCTTPKYVWYKCENPKHRVRFWRPEGDPKGHEWDNWGSATPTADGKYEWTRQCKACSETDKKTADHSNGYNDMIGESNHNEYKSHTGHNTGAADETNLPEGEKLSTAAKCGKEGKTWYYCSKCKVYFWQYVDALEHIAGTPEEVAATETKAGYKKTVCTQPDCGEVIEYVTIPPTSFDTANNDADDFDFTELVDLSEYVFVDGSKHTEGYLKKDSYVPSTCAKEGTVTFFCVDCKRVVTAKLAKAPHTAGKDTKKEIIKEPNCTESGTVKYTGCSVCGDTTVTWEESILATPTGHVRDESVAEKRVEPTCDKEGSVTYVCKKCGEEYVATTLPKIGHDFADNKQDTIVPSTCVEDGQYVKAIICKNCGAIQPGSEEDNKVIDKVDHQKLLDEMVEADKFFTVDAETKKVTVSAEVLAKVGEKNEYTIEPVEVKDTHDNIVSKYGELKVVYTPATCTEDGHISVTCTKEGCKAAIEQDLTKLGHKFVILDSVPLDDCTVPTKVLVKCVNGCEELREVALPTYAEHNFDLLVGYAQERQGGNVAKYDIWDYNEIEQEPEGDDWDLWYEKAIAWAKSHIGTCSDYDEIYLCTNYSEYEEYSWVDEDGNEYILGVGCGQKKRVLVKGDGEHAKPANYLKKDATCTEEGYEAFECEKCHLVFPKVTPALGHNMVDGKVTTPATCTKTGVRQTYCDRCCEYKDGKLVAKPGCEIVTGTKEVPTINHNWIVKAKDADCVKGVVGYYYEECSMCKARRNEKMNITGHVAGDDRIVTKKATCTETGLQSYVCTNCHEWVPNEVIPALGHSYQRKDGKILTDEDVKKAHEAAAANCTDDCVAASCLTDAKHVLKCADCTANLTWTQADTAIGKHQEPAESKDVYVLTAPNCTRTGKAQFKCLKCDEIVDYELPKLPHNLMGDYDEEKNVYYFYCEEIWNDTAGCEDLQHLIAETYPESAVIGGAVYASLISATPAGQTFGTFGACEYKKEVEATKTAYEISKISDSKGKLELVDDNSMAHLDDPYVRITWRYTLANGDTVSFTTCRETKWEKDELTFKLIGLKAPAGSTCDFIYVEVVTDSDADLLYAGQYTTYGAAQVK